MHHGAKLHVVNIDLYPEACICVGCVAAGCEGFASMLLLQGHQNSVCTWQFQAQEPFLLQVALWHAMPMLYWNVLSMRH